MKRKFVIIESKEGKAKNGNFYTKIARKVETPFGEKVAESYNVKGTKLMEVGTEIEIDFNIFEGKEYDSTFADDNGNMITRKVKWLHLKVA